MKLSISFLPLIAALACAAPVQDPNGMTPCLQVCNEQAAIVGECWNGYLDKDCTCPSLPYLHALKRCLKASCPYSDWELSVKLHFEVCKTPLLEGDSLD